MWRYRVPLWAFLLSVAGQGPVLAAGSRQETSKAQQDQQDLIREESIDYYAKWLTEDVVYIITSEEKDVFLTLTTSEEKERFIEQFWYRRDPDVMTSENEFKEEHYRRIAYANERFASGEPGWMTDRGRVYIIHGPPDELESHPNGGAYNRPTYEGGGSTSTFPFEIWWYRNIDGVGSDVELEFVDRNGGNQYRLALDPDYKDVLLHVQSAGETMAEEMGIAKKKDRPAFSPFNRSRYPFMNQRAKDDPFIRYERFAFVTHPKEVKYKDLEEIVKVNVDYNSLSFKVRNDFFKLNDLQVIVPITVELNNKDLSFSPEGSNQTARLGIYGMITSLQNRVVAEFEDDVTTRFPAASLERGLKGRSLYQKIVTLDRRLRYRLDLVVKDLASGQIGVVRKAIVPPDFGEEEFCASSLVLSDFIEILNNDSTKDDEMFVLGDVWMRPSISKEFSVSQGMGLYLQLYNFGIDQSSLLPDLTVDYRVFKDDRTVLEVSDPTGESVHFFSGRRVVLVRPLPVNLLEPGNYRVEVHVRDGILNQELSSSEHFVLSPQ
jgi:GWxTD domain-containing protein